MSRLSSPDRVQDFLNGLKFNFETRGETCCSPRLVLRQRAAHCMEGAMLAAAALEYHGARPLVVDLRAARHDFDHVIAVFHRRGWGAVSKTNHAVLRYREPVYRSLRELVMSYFHEYFLDSGQKTLREYSRPLDLNVFNRLDWRTTEKPLFAIPQRLDQIKHFSILDGAQIRRLRPADAVEIRAGKITEWRPPAGR